MDKQFMKFGIVGASGSIISLTTLYLFTDIAGLHYILSYLIAFAIATGSNYYWNNRFTFNNNTAKKHSITKYYSINLFSIAVKTTGLFILTDLMGLWYMASAVVMIAIGFIINFTLAKRLVWQQS